jgi:hypothetical protein
VGGIIGTPLESNGVPILVPIQTGFLQFEDNMQFLLSDGSSIFSSDTFAITIYLDYYPEGFDS